MTQLYALEKILIWHYHTGEQERSHDILLQDESRTTSCSTKATTLIESSVAFAKLLCILIHEIMSS